MFYSPMSKRPQNTPSLDAHSFNGPLGPPKTSPSLAGSSISFLNSYRPKKTRATSNNSTQFQLPLIVRRIFKPPTLDFETATWEIIHLILQPKRVYKSLYYHKQTKRKWARDDPSFIILLVGLLTLSAIAWGVIKSPSAVFIGRSVLHMVIIDFLAIGFVISTVSWFLTNKFFKSSDIVSLDETERQDSGDTVEWGYCFDVHCNSFLLIWVLLYLVQLILLPILVMDNFVSRLLGNTLYFFSWSQYVLITFYGYNSLPFLRKTEFILVPIPVFAIMWLVLTLGGFSVPAVMSAWYY